MPTNRYTRDVILDRAGELAGRTGLAGLTMAAVARQLGLPRSLVSFHFRCRAGLQVAVLDEAARELARDMVRPALQAPEGLPRLVRLFDSWLELDGRGGSPGGGLFIATVSEFNDRPGPVRDRLLRLCMLWRHLLAGMVNAAVAAGDLRADLDRDQFLHDLHGIMLAYHHARRLLRDPDADRRARLAFAALIARAAVATGMGPPA